MRINPIIKSSQSNIHREISSTYESPNKRRVNEEGLSFSHIFEQVKKDSSDRVKKNTNKK